MPYTYKKLRERIIKKYGSQSKFAEALNVTPSFVSVMLTGKRGFSQKRIEQWAELLDIPKKDYLKYFFA